MSWNSIVYIERLKFLCRAECKRSCTCTALLTVREAEFDHQESDLVVKGSVNSELQGGRFKSQGEGE